MVVLWRGGVGGPQGGPKSCKSRLILILSPKGVPIFTQGGPLGGPKGVKEGGRGGCGEGVEGRE